MKTVKELRIELIKKMRVENIESLEASLGLIIMNVLHINKTELIIGDRQVSPEEENEILVKAERLLKGEPIQYIVGFCEFMSLKFLVSEEVLIPRRDTEILTEVVIERLCGRAATSLTDIGCGSGIIGISLAHYISDLTVTAIDVSAKAIEIAKKNADAIGVSDRINFVQADIFKGFPDISADCIVSNPPYIRTDVIPTLERGVKYYEPVLALDGGEDGLKFYKRIASAPILKKGGLLAFEIGYDQSGDVSKILKINGFNSVEVLPDIEGRDRVVLGIKG